MTSVSIYIHITAPFLFYCLLIGWDKNSGNVWSRLCNKNKLLCDKLCKLCDFFLSCYFKLVSLLWVSEEGNQFWALTKIIWTQRNKKVHHGLCDDQNISLLSTWKGNFLALSFTVDSILFFSQSSVLQALC